MRTGDPSPLAEGEDDPEILFSAQSTMFPAVPSPTQIPEAASSMSTFMPMQYMPANAMSPDDMLRTYTERHSPGGTGGVKGPTVPSPTFASSGAQGGVRTLCSPTRSRKHMTLESQYCIAD